MRSRHRLMVALVATIAVLAAACGSRGDSGPLDQAEAIQAARRTGRRHRLGRRPGHPERVDPAADGRQPGRHTAAARRVPDHRARRRRARTKSSRCGRRPRSRARAATAGCARWPRTSTPKAITLSDGSVAGVDLRYIASGTGYQFIARGDELPQGFTPSNQLWVEMASEFQPMTEVSAQHRRTTSPGS